MKCSVIKFANKFPHIGKPVVEEKAWKIRAKCAMVMNAMMRKGDKNLTIATVLIDGIDEFAIVRTSHNGL